MLVNSKIKIKVNNRKVKYYKEKGYTNFKGGDEMIINIEDLPKNSHYIVDVICDRCETKDKIKYYNYVQNIIKGIYSCRKCSHHSIVESNLKKYGVRSTLELDDVKEKSKNTLIKKYGVEHYSKTDEFIILKLMSLRKK